MINVKVIIIFIENEEQRLHYFYSESQVALLLVREMQFYSFKTYKDNA